MRLLKHFLKKIICYYRWIPFVFRRADFYRRFVLVTAADKTHFKSLLQFLTSAHKYEADSFIIVYDLGFQENQKNEIRNRFKSVELRPFLYEHYPDYFNIKINAGEYAWKPIIIKSVMDEFKSSICWMDAGNIITSKLTKIRKVIDAVGLYSPQSAGSVKEWTHPKTLAYLNASNQLLEKINLCASCVCVNYHNHHARRLINQWADYALKKDCIAPNGSDRSNHRQDQAVLTLLFHQSGLAKHYLSNPNFLRYLDLKIHQDID